MTIQEYLRQNPDSPFSDKYMMKYFGPSDESNEGGKKTKKPQNANLTLESLFGEEAESSEDDGEDTKYPPNTQRLVIGGKSTKSKSTLDIREDIEKKVSGMVELSDTIRESTKNMHILPRNAVPATTIPDKMDEEEHDITPEVEDMDTEPPLDEQEVSDHAQSNDEEIPEISISDDTNGEDTNGEDVLFEDIPAKIITPEIVPKKLPPRKKRSDKSYREQKLGESDSDDYDGNGEFSDDQDDTGDEGVVNAPPIQQETNPKPGLKKPPQVIFEVPSKHDPTKNFQRSSISKNITKILPSGAKSTNKSIATSVQDIHSRMMTFAKFKKNPLNEGVLFQLFTRLCDNALWDTVKKLIPQNENSEDLEGIPSPHKTSKLDSLMLVHFGRSILRDSNQSATENVIKCMAWLYPDFTAKEVTTMKRATTQVDYTITFGKEIDPRNYDTCTNELVSIRSKMRKIVSDETIQGETFSWTHCGEDELYTLLNCVNAIHIKKMITTSLYVRISEVLNDPASKKRPENKNRKVFYVTHQKPVLSENLFVYWYNFIQMCNLSIDGLKFPKKKK